MRKMTKRAAAVSAAVVVAVGGAGAAAYAAGWFKGTGAATASTTGIQSVRADATVEGNLYPGATRDVKAFIDNPNEFPVKIDSLTKPTLIIKKKDGTVNAACTAANAGITVAPIAPVTVGAGAVDKEVWFSKAVSMSLEANEACADSTFELKFDLLGAVTAA